MASASDLCSFINTKLPLPTHLYDVKCSKSFPSLAAVATDHASPGSKLLFAAVARSAPRILFYFILFSSYFLLLYPFLGSKIRQKCFFADRLSVICNYYRLDYSISGGGGGANPPRCNYDLDPGKRSFSLPPSPQSFPFRNHSPIW